MPAVKITLDQALDDVESRFLYNLPLSDLQQVERLFFQIEQAYWYYEDFKADLHPQSLPHFSNLKSFATKIFSHCPLLRKVEDKFQELFSDFRSYKSKIPVYGSILLNPRMNKVLLVCDYQSKTWTFPRGKVNENEDAFTCAMRETFEETGFNPSSHCREEDNLEAFYDGKKVKLFIGTGVPDNTVFTITTRKEIAKIGFHAIDDLPKTYGVNPFLSKLRRWVSKRQQQQQQRAGVGVTKASPKLKGIPIGGISTPATPERHPKKGPKNPFDNRNADTFALDFDSNSNSSNSTSAVGTSIIGSNSSCSNGNSKGWSVSDMFNANAQLTGRDYSDYDGDPQKFGAVHPRYVDYGKLPTPVGTPKADNNYYSNNDNNNNNDDSSSSNNNIDNNSNNSNSNNSSSNNKNNNSKNNARQSQMPFTAPPSAAVIKRTTAAGIAAVSSLDGFMLPPASVSAATSVANKNKNKSVSKVIKLPPRQYFPVDFQFDVAAIMAAVDQALATAAAASANNSSG